MNSVLLFSILSFIEHCHGSNMYQKAAKFCFENGLTYLTISSMNFVTEEVLQMTKPAHERNLMTRVIEFKDIPTTQRFYSDALMLLLDSNVLEYSEEFQNYITMTQFTNIKRTLIVFTTELSERHLVLLKEQIRLMNENAMFQILFQNENDESSQFYQVISINPEVQ